MLRSCACLIWFWREGRHPVDSSEPAVNFLGRREFMAKTRWRQLSLVPELLGEGGRALRRYKLLQFNSWQSKVWPAAKVESRNSTILSTYNQHFDCIG